MEISKKVKDRAFLIGLYNNKESKEDYYYTVEELKNLTETANATVVDTFIQKLDKPNSATYLGKGKIAEIAEKALNENVDTLIFNDNLTPAQARNIAKITKCNIVDRTELILDIFSKHAKTKHAKIQVELALLEYNYSKLRNLWQHFSRIEGGIGFRGPGEKQIELDRREIKKKISVLKQRLNEIEKISLTKRNKRKNLKCAAIVGYTNAGKTTIFNRLTKENRYVANQLFATLDSKTRSVFINGNDKVLLTDTIGFIKKLPHNLVKSFHSTLLEVMEADLLVHVVDFSKDNVEDFILSVENVLKEINADNKDTIHVFNKIDVLDEITLKFKKKKYLSLYPESVFISAKNDLSMDKLTEKIELYLSEKQEIRTFYIPEKLKKLKNYLDQNSDIISLKYDELNKQFIIDVKIAYAKVSDIEKQINDFYENEYINNKIKKNLEDENDKQFK